MPSEFEKQYSRAWLSIGIVAAVALASVLGLAAFVIASLIG